MSQILLEAENTLYIRVFGSEELTIPSVTRHQIAQLGLDGEELKLIRVVGIGLGLKGSNCTRINNPFFLLVGGVGKSEICEDEDFPPDTKVWVLNRNATTTKLIPTSGKIEELLFLDQITDDASFSGLDVKISGSLSIKVKERSDNNICVEYKAGAKASFRVFGSGWQKLASVSVGGEECINNNACIEVIDEDYITAKLCYEPGSNRVCLKGKVGYRGASAKFTECWSL